MEALQGFREGEHRILIATDIAARGIDIPIIEHIVNYGMPETVEDYIHRRAVRLVGPWVARCPLSPPGGTARYPQCREGHRSVPAEMYS